MRQDPSGYMMILSPLLLTITLWDKIEVTWQNINRITGIQRRKYLKFDIEFLFTLVKNKALFSVEA
jgi:hypothetical protein